MASANNPEELEKSTQIYGSEQLTGEPILLHGSDERLAFLAAISESATLTPAQKQLGTLMRGES